MLVYYYCVNVSKWLPMHVGFCYLDFVISGITVPAPVCSGPLPVGETDNFTLGLRSAGTEI